MKHRFVFDVHFEFEDHNIALVLLDLSTKYN